MQASISQALALVNVTENPPLPVYAAPNYCGIPYMVRTNWFLPLSYLLNSYLSQIIKIIETDSPN